MPVSTQGPGLGHGRAPAAAQSSTKNQYSKMALSPLKRHMVAYLQSLELGARMNREDR